MQDVSSAWSEQYSALLHGQFHGLFHGTRQIRAFTPSSERPSLGFDEDYLVTYNNATAREQFRMPGAEFFSYLEQLFEAHSMVSAYSFQISEGFCSLFGRECDHHPEPMPVIRIPAPIGDFTTFNQLTATPGCATSP